MLSRQFTLARRPVGRPTEADFTLAEVELPAPDERQVLIENTHISVDPYMRGLIIEGESAHPPYAIGEPMSGAAVGRVLESGSPRFKPGQTVSHPGGWRDVALVEEAEVRVIDVTAVPPSAYLGVLGLTGFTAYVGIRSVGAVGPGDRVFVSAAAGAVGSVAGQLARRLGASRVVGSAGSAEKVRHLVDDLGFDAAFDYHDGSMAEQLAAAAPEGIDVCFDNVGGEQLEAALSSMRERGRVVLCGALAHPSIWHEAPGPRNLALAIPKRLTMRGYVTTDHEDQRAAFEEEVTAALADGSIVARETVVEGLEETPRAFLGLLTGDNVGKMVVSV